MPDLAPRRAGAYRHRAHQLTETAAREPHEDRRRHMLELAAQYQRPADTLAPPTRAGFAALAIIVPSRVQ